MGMVVRLQLAGRVGMIVRLQQVIGMIVLVTVFADRMIMAVAVLVRVRMNVRMRVFMGVSLAAVTVLMPVGMSVLMVMLMPVLVTASHRCVSPDLLASWAFLPAAILKPLSFSVRRWRGGCNRCRRRLHGYRICPRMDRAPPFPPALNRCGAVSFVLARSDREGAILPAVFARRQSRRRKP